MPIYDTLGDKTSVVLDIGTAYTKIGFTGEYAPRAIIRTEIRSKRTNHTRKIIDYNDAQDLYDLLVDFIHVVYFKYVLYSPKDRPVVLVESLLCPTLFRETLAKVLFMHYEVSSVLILPSHLVSVSPLGAETALVLDVGYTEAVVIPVCFGFPIIDAWQALPIAAHAVHKNLKSLIHSDNTGVGDLQETLIEDIKVRCCFVTKKQRSEQISSSKPDFAWSPDVDYPVGHGETIKITGKTREKAFEIMHEEDNDHLCLATIILDAIMKVDLHLRNTLAENILLIGGTTMIPGFKARLQEELYSQVKQERYKKLEKTTFKFHVCPAKENYMAWLGGAIYGATELLSMKSFTRDSYLKENRLPDWSNLKDRSL